MSKEATTVARGTTTELSVGLSVALMVGVGMVVATLGRKRMPPARSAAGERYAALTAYLHEHLTGADAAIHVVERFRAGRRAMLTKASCSRPSMPSSKTTRDGQGDPRVRSVPRRVAKETPRSGIWLRAKLLAGGSRVICRCSGRWRRWLLASRGNGACGARFSRFPQMCRSRGVEACPNWKRRRSASGKSSRSADVARAADIRERQHVGERLISEDAPTREDFVGGERSRRGRRRGEGVERPESRRPGAKELVDAILETTPTPPTLHGR